MKDITDIQGVKGLKCDIEQSTVRLKMRKTEGDAVLLYEWSLKTSKKGDIF